MDKEKYENIFDAILDSSIKEFKKIIKTLSTEDLNTDWYKNSPLSFLIVINGGEEKASIAWNKIDFTKTNKDKETMLMQAVSTSDLDLVKKLIPVSNINALNKKKENVLFYSADTKMLDFLISHGANVNQVNTHKRNLINHHIHTPKAMLFFIDKGLDYKTLNYDELDKDMIPTYRAMMKPFEEKEALEKSLHTVSKNKSKTKL